MLPDINHISPMDKVIVERSGMTEKSEKGKEQEGKKYESIKVKTETREKLREAAKGMDVGIGAAVEILVDARQKAISDKIGDISGITGEIADILLESGLLDIKFKGSGIDNVSMEDDCIIIHGFIKAGVADEDARLEIFEVIRRGLEGEA